MFMNVIYHLYDYFSYILWLCELKTRLKVSIVVLLHGAHFSVATASVYYQEKFAKLLFVSNRDLRFSDHTTLTCAVHLWRNTAKVLAGCLLYPVTDFFSFFVSGAIKVLL